MQVNWIGCFEGVEIIFDLVLVVNDIVDLMVYIMCLDIFYGVIYVVVVVQYFFVEFVVKLNLDLVVFIDECKNIKVVEVELVIMEKKGFVMGFEVVYLLIGEKFLIWVVNFVLMDYGLGVVMVVFGYDQCDWEFVIKYNLFI